MIETRDAVDLNSLKGEVKFCNVSFAYGSNMPLVLDRLNLHIKAGETVAFMGPSGGGKTTLVKLLLRLYDPLSGKLLILQLLVLTFWRNSCFQGFLLFNTHIL